MKKKLVQLTILLTLLCISLGVSAFSSPGADCCSRYCGDDKNCYYWCRHDTGGPCPTSIIAPANP